MKVCDFLAIVTTFGFLALAIGVLVALAQPPQKDDGKPMNCDRSRCPIAQSRLVGGSKS
jgi:hypothetical protein